MSSIFRSVSGRERLRGSSFIPRRQAHAIELLESRMLLSPIPLGPEFRVNSTLAGDQEQAAVASDAKGDLVVAWLDGSSIHAQQYAPGGAPRGGEFVVNSTTAANSGPSVAMADNGTFVITWFGIDFASSVTPLGVDARRFNAAGAAQGAEFRATGLTQKFSSKPVVAMDAAGDFVISWAGREPASSSGAIEFRRYNSAGIAQFGPQGVMIAPWANAPSIAMNSSGQFVIAYYWWSGLIFAKQYDASGALQGQQISVNTPYNAQSGPSVAMDSAGDFVVAWEEKSTLGVDARRFSASGTALGPEFSVVATPGYSPQVLMTTEGAFVVTWQDLGLGASLARQYTAAGVAQGAAVPVGAADLSLAGNADGDVVAAWTGVDPDGSKGISARRYTLSVEISGIVFDDSDADGTRAGTEPGLTGWTVYLDQNGNGQLDLGSAQTTASSDVPQMIEPAQFDPFLRHVFPGMTDATLSASNLVGAITDVNVSLGITFGHTGDLSAVLVSPAGTRVTLFNGVGGAGANFTNTTFDGQAATAITAGSAPFTGTFRPQGNLAAFNGEDPLGVWAVELTDRNVGLQGTLDAFSLTFTTTGETRTTSGAGGAYSFAGLRHGNYLVREVQQAGWICSAPPGGATGVALKGGATNTLDFGNYQLGSISGTAFDDLNADGVRDKGEPGVPGWLIYQDVDGDGVYNAGGPQKTVSTDVPQTFGAAIPAHSTATVAGVLGRVTDIDLTLDLSAPLKGDVGAVLYNAAGDSIVLFQSYPASSGNLNTTFDDQAAFEFTHPSPPYSGTFRPAMPLSHLAGSDPNGVWTLELTSSSALPLDHGVLNGWSLTLTAATEPSITTDANGDYVFAPLRPGSYVIREQSVAGWNQTLPKGGSYAVALTSGRAVSGCDFGNTAQRLVSPLPPAFGNVRIDAAERRIVPGNLGRSLPPTAPPAADASSPPRRTPFVPVTRSVLIGPA